MTFIVPCSSYITSPVKVPQRSKPLYCVMIDSPMQFAVGQQFDGLFGKWTLDERDRKEVLSYRVGLTIAAAGLVSYAFQFLLVCNLTAAWCNAIYIRDMINCSGILLTYIPPTYPATCTQDVSKTYITQLSWQTQLLPSCQQTIASNLF